MPLSYLICIECMNKFLHVSFDSATSTLACIFQNQPTTVMASVTRSCSFEYWKCDQNSRDAKFIEHNSTSNTIAAKLTLQGSNHAYCYMVTGSNGTTTVQVVGRIGKLLVMLCLCVMIEVLCRYGW